MKLFILHAGDITTPDKALLTPGIDEGIPYRFPVSAYLIEHEKGLALVDLGYNTGHWPKHLLPDAHFDDSQRPDRVIEKLGYKTKDIKYVILSHYHIDHCGWMELFPHPEYIVRRSEAMFAWWPPNRGHGWGSYCFPDYEHSRDYKYIELPDDIDYDVFGDGSVVLIDTKGHTRGHQSVIVNLPESGKIVLAIDAASLREHLDGNIQPCRLLWNAEESFKSIAKLRALRDNGALVIMGHEAEQWPELKKAPEFYK